MTTVPLVNDLMPAGPHAAYDHHQLMQRLGHDHGLLAELRKLLAVESARKLGELATAIVTANRLAVVGVAHCLRGMLSTFSAARACDVAAEIERAARRDRLDQADSLLDRLSQELQTLHAELQAATDFIERGIAQ